MYIYTGHCRHRHCLQPSLCPMHPCRNRFQLQISATLCMRGPLAAGMQWAQEQRADQTRPKVLGSQGPLEHPLTTDWPTKKDQLSRVLAFRCANPEACCTQPLRGLEAMSPGWLPCLPPQKCTPYRLLSLPCLNSPTPWKALPGLPSQKRLPAFTSLSQDLLLGEPNLNQRVFIDWKKESSKKF